MEMNELNKAIEQGVKTGILVAFAFENSYKLIHKSHCTSEMMKNALTLAQVVLLNKTEIKESGKLPPPKGRITND